MNIEKIIRHKGCFSALSIIVLVVLIGAVVWMSFSRISNINEVFISSLSKETKYEFTDDTNIESPNKLINFAGQNIIIYDETIPKNLKIADNNSNDVLYALPKDSDILKIKDSGYAGFYNDLWIVSIVLLFIYLGFYYYYKKLFDAYEEKVKELSEFQDVFVNINTIEDFRKNYGEIGNKISNISNYFKNIWWEFCETLIIKREDDSDNPNEYNNKSPITVLKNTDQIEVYINTETIIDKQIENRDVFEVIPGILTGLGLVGTFLAIAIALMGFDMGRIELSIQNLLGGLSIKFISSLAGIATSILFLYIKSNLFSDLDKTISDEQNKLNYIFPRRTTESYLCYIWQQMEDQQKTLKDLRDIAEDQKERAENFVNDMGTQIKDILQESVQKDIKAVLDDLNKNLANSISGDLREPIDLVIKTVEELKSIKEQSSAEPLKAIVEELKNIFSDSFVGAFQNVGQETANSFNNGLNDSIANMSNQNAKLEDLVNIIGSYIEQLHNYESRVENNYSGLIDNIDKTLNTQNDYIKQNEQFVQNLAEASNKISTTTSNLDDASDKINDASYTLKNSLEVSDSIVQNTSGQIETIGENATKLNSNLTDLIAQFRTKTFEEIEAMFSAYTKSITEVCGKISDSVQALSETGLEDLSDNIDELNKNLVKMNNRNE